MERMSTLPMIKCSTCAVDIDILHLADHVCAVAPPPLTTVPEPMSPLSPVSPDSPKFNRAATFGGPTFSNRSDRQAPTGRMPPPPRIDPNAANMPFRPLEPSPMSNYSDPQSRSPHSAQPPKSPYTMTRSVTTPVTRSMAPPSSDYTSNLDSAFPRFPTKSPKSVKPRPRERLEPFPQDYAMPSPLFAPLSPRIDGGMNIAKRMNTIAPGPFTDRRPSTANASKSFEDNGPEFGHRRTATQGSGKSNDGMQNQRTSTTSSASRSSGYSNRSAGYPSGSKPSTGAAMAPPLPSTSEQSEGIDAFLDRLEKESTEPSRTEQDNISRANMARQNSGGRKAPPPRPRRPSERDLPPADMVDMNNSQAMPRPANMYPSRGSSRDGSENDMPKGLARQPLRPPPLVAAALGIDAPLNALHTPSDSGFSDDSYASSGYRSIASSRSSPPESVAGHSRQTSKISRSDFISEESAERNTSPESYAQPQAVAVAPRTYMRPDGAESIPRSLSPGYAKYPESPMDPAIQMGAGRDMRSREPRTPTELSMSPPRPMPEPEMQKPEVRRAKTTSKGNCRGCSEPITGKSVKDSSGRLTGRYHKQCFVCRTCADPFPTAEFYVYENSPYCEQHYHKLNGSLCGACNRGIEGQYLETDTRQKFHPRCFTCTTCRIVLRDGYFDVGGRRYCDRHAQSAANPRRDYLGPGGYKPRNLQKRGTRLMMMA